MRDQTYDLDLLLLQTSLVVLGPDHVLTLLTDRFSLNNWFSSSPTAPFDEAQNASMAEEFYSLIICIFFFFPSFIVRCIFLIRPILSFVE